MFGPFGRRRAIRVPPPGRTRFPANPQANNFTPEALRSIFEVLSNLEIYTHALIEVLSEGGGVNITSGTREREGREERDRRRRRVETDYALGRLDRMIDRYLGRAERFLAVYSEQQLKTLSSAFTRSGLLIGLSIKRDLRDIFVDSGYKLQAVARELGDRATRQILRLLMRSGLFFTKDMVVLVARRVAISTKAALLEVSRSILARGRSLAAKNISLALTYLSSLPVLSNIVQRFSRGGGSQLSRLTQFGNQLLGRLGRLGRIMGKFSVIAGKLAGALSFLSIGGLLKILSAVGPFLLSGLFSLFRFSAGIVRSVTSWVVNTAISLAKKAFNFVKGIITAPIQEFIKWISPAVEALKSLGRRAARFFSIGLFTHMALQVLLRFLGLPQTARRLAQISQRFAILSFSFFRELLGRVDWARLFKISYDVLAETFSGLFSFLKDLAIDFYSTNKDQIMELIASAVSFAQTAIQYITPYLGRWLQRLRREVVSAMHGTIGASIEYAFKEFVYQMWNVLYTIGNFILSLPDLLAQYVLKKLAGKIGIHLPDSFVRTRWDERELDRLAMRQFLGLQVTPFEQLSPEMQRMIRRQDAMVATLQGMSRISSFDFRGGVEYMRVGTQLLKESMRSRREEIKEMKRATQELNRAADSLREASEVFRESTERYHQATNRASESISTAADLTRLFGEASLYRKVVR